MVDQKRVRARLSREVLVAAALEIADRDGLDALSMRRLGAELDVDPTAAYRHFPDKKALLAGVVEAVLAGADVETDMAAPWSEQFREVALAYRRVMLAHSPAVARLAATTPLNSLESLRIVEHAVAILTEGAVPLPQAVAAIQAVGQLTTGSVLLEAFWREWADAGGEVYLSPPMLPHPELPALSKASAEDFLTPERVFEFGLGAVIGGLEGRDEDNAGGSLRPSAPRRST
jgi:TetR/AcrR family transcriptional regulator, tetracycline repressor protein